MCALALVLAGLVPAHAQQDRESALGAQMAAEIRKQMSVVSDPATRLYISELVTKLAGRDYPITLEVIDTHSSDEPTEPLWLVGHYVFVPTALIRNARDESELAGMLAHTLAHESRRDWIRFDSAGPIPLYVIGREGTLKNEFNADAEAARSMQKAGYDPAALLRYVSRLHASDTGRIAALEKVVQDLRAPTDTVVDTSGFQRIQEKYRPVERPRVRPTLLR